MGSHGGGFAESRSPVAASTVVEVLERRKQWTLATVRTLLRRLVNKGALQQQADGRRAFLRR